MEEFFDCPEEGAPAEQLAWLDLPPPHPLFRTLPCVEIKEPLKKFYRGCSLVAGVDEVGRGPLAGPVVAAAVVFERGYRNKKIRDSKQLSAEVREKLVDVIKRNAKQWAIVAVGARRIERINIREASRLAMTLALRRIVADLVLVDGNVPIHTRLPQKTVVGGDDLHVEISAASILAKVWRDRLMAELAKKYAGYGFEEHAGYATQGHLIALRKQGPCRIHRATFGGVREYLLLKGYAPKTTSLCTSKKVSDGAARQISLAPENR